MIRLYLPPRGSSVFHINRTDLSKLVPRENACRQRVLIPLKCKYKTGQVPNKEDPQDVKV